MNDNRKNFWRLVDYIRRHYLTFERIVGTQELLRLSRHLMKDYQRRKSYYGDTWEVFNDFLRETVDPCIKNIMEDWGNGEDYLR